MPKDQKEPKEKQNWNDLASLTSWMFIFRLWERLTSSSQQSLENMFSLNVLAHPIASRQNQILLQEPSTKPSAYRRMPGGVEIII